MAMASPVTEESTASSSSDSSSDESLSVRGYRVPDVAPNDTQQFFQYEPKPGTLFQRYRRRENAETVDHEQPHQSPQRGNECECGNCQTWLDIKDKERQCCKHIRESCDIRHEVDVNCITAHPDFKIVCFNTTIRKITEATFHRKERKRYYRNLQRHKQNRYTAYCNMARWLYGRLGHRDRQPLPNCVVYEIRKHFTPVEIDIGTHSVSTYPGYTGFKEATDDSDEIPGDARDDEEMDAE